MPPSRGRLAILAIVAVSSTLQGGCADAVPTEPTLPGLDPASPTVLSLSASPADVAARAAAVAAVTDVRERILPAMSTTGSAAETLVAAFADLDLALAHDQAPAIAGALLAVRDALGRMTASGDPQSAHALPDLAAALLAAESAALLLPPGSRPELPALRAPELR